MRDEERDDLPAPKSAALAAMYWRSEILQVMYWLRGEGFGDLVDVPMIEQFLGMHAEVGITYLDQLVEQDYLVREGDWFALSELGIKEGGEEFAAAFSDLMRPTHGECSDDCWCHASTDEAVACVAARSGHPGHDHAGHDHD